MNAAHLQNLAERLTVHREIQLYGFYPITLNEWTVLECCHF